MPLESSNIAATESFPPDVCPTCGYSLNGLPLCGICPECGVRYDDTQLILYGWACGQHATPSNTKGWRLLLTVIPITFTWQLMSVSFPWRVAMLATWIVFVINALMRRTSTDHSGGVQVRLNSKGIVQLDDLAIIRKKPEVADKQFQTWDKVNMVIWSQANETRLRFRMALRKSWFGLETYPIDAELECARAESEKLRERIRLWQERKTLNSSII
jgi:hypothetical protein